MKYKDYFLKYNKAVCTTRLVITKSYMLIQNTENKELLWGGAKLIWDSKKREALTG